MRVLVYTCTSKCKKKKSKKDIKVTRVYDIYNVQVYICILIMSMSLHECTESLRIFKWFKYSLINYYRINKKQEITKFLLMKCFNTSSLRFAIYTNYI